MGRRLCECGTDGLCQRDRGGRLEGVVNLCELFVYLVFVGPSAGQSHDRWNPMIRHENEELSYRLLRLIDQ